MPIYQFRDKNTGKEWEDQMSIAAKEEFIKNNPHIIQVLTGLNIGDSVQLGITKPDSTFQKHILGRIKANAPGAKGLEKKFKIPREW